MQQYNNTTEIVDIYSKYNSLQDAIDDNPSIESQTTAASLSDLLVLTVPPALPPDPPAIYEPYVAQYANGDGLYIGNYVVQAEASQGFYQDTGSAASAYNGYVAAGGQVSEFQKSAQVYIPAALYGPAVYIQSLTGWSLGSILTVGATTVNCGAAAIIGYDIGTRIQEQNPEFWEDVFRAIAPWSFDLIDRHFGVVDYGGRTYLDSRVYEALHDMYRNMPPVYELDITSQSFPAVYSAWQQLGGFPTTASNVYRYYVHTIYSDTWTEIRDISTTANAVYYQSTGPRTYNSTYNAYNYPNSPYAGRSVVFYSDSPFTVTYKSRFVSGSRRDPASTEMTEDVFAKMTGDFSNNTLNSGSWTHNNKTVYYTSLNIGSSYNVGCWYQYPYTEVGVPSSTVSGPGGGHNYITDYGIAWLMQYSSKSGIGVDGVEPWTGQIPSDPYEDSIDVAIDEQGNTVKFIPFSLPYKDGSGHLDSAINYDPTQYVNAAQQVSAYAQNQSISNYRDLLNRVDSNSDPTANPSQPDSPPVLNPTVPTTAPDSGISPPILPIATPPIFDPGSSNPSGLINVYNPTSAQLYSFGNWLWVTYRDISLDKVLNNPFDGVISLHEIFSTPVRGVAQSIRSGFLDSNVFSLTVPQRYSQLNCGSIVIPEYFRNYLDYSPYTKVYIFLPFIGIKEVDAEDIIGAGVNITYAIDSYTGACVAMITTAKDGYEAITYQWEGNCSVQYPITGGTQMQTLLSMAQGALNAISGLFSGNTFVMPTLSVSGVAEGLSSALDYTKVKSSVYRSGSLTGNFGAMSGKIPYVIVKRPKQVVVPNYNDFYGYPAHKYVVLGQCSGYLRCKEVHVNSARATDDEKREIESLLKEGVYVN